MNEPIPFFSDLPIKAIPAVQRLHDEAQAPGYSLPAVYSNLVSRLHSAGVSSPARKYVKQWLAAVKIGRAARPELPEGIAGPDPALAPMPGYFDSLPDAAMPALVAAWEAIQASAGADNEDDADERVFEAFFDAMLALKHIEPSWRGFVAWAKAVRLGQIGRPGQAAPSVEMPASEDAPLDGAGEPKRRSRRVKADVMVLNPATGDAVQPDIVVEAAPDTGHIISVAITAGADLDVPTRAPAYVPLTPGNFREFAQKGGVIVPETARISFTPAADPAPVSDEVATRLRSVRSQLVADTCATLEADIRRRAERIVIDQLRAMADELEAGVA